jgi:hypothetical protein
MQVTLNLSLGQFAILQNMTQTYVQLAAEDLAKYPEDPFYTQQLERAADVDHEVADAIAAACAKFDEEYAIAVAKLQKDLDLEADPF